MAPQRTSVARSPWASRWEAAHKVAAQRKGWRVTRKMPGAGSCALAQASPPSTVGLLVVSPATARMKAKGMTKTGIMRSSGNGGQTS